MTNTWHSYITVTHSPFSFANCNDLATLVHLLVNQACMQHSLWWHHEFACLVLPLDFIKYFENKLSIHKLNLHLLGQREVCLHFEQFHFIVKGHHADTFPSSIFDVGHLLAGIGIDDSLRSYTKLQDCFDFSLCAWNNTCLTIATALDHTFFLLSVYVSMNNARSVEVSSNSTLE